MGAWAACGTNGPSAHPERGRPGCGQPRLVARVRASGQGVRQNKLDDVTLALRAKFQPSMTHIHKSLLSA